MQLQQLVALTATFWPLRSQTVIVDPVDLAIFLALPFKSVTSGWTTTPQSRASPLPGSWFSGKLASKLRVPCVFCWLFCQNCPYQMWKLYALIKSQTQAKLAKFLIPIDRLFFSLEGFIGTRYQSGSFSLINVRSGFYCLLVFNFLSFDVSVNAFSFLCRTYVSNKYEEERKFFLDLMWLFQVYDAQMLPPVFGTKNVEPKSYNWLTSK